MLFCLMYEVINDSTHFSTLRSISLLATHCWGQDRESVAARQTAFRGAVGRKGRHFGVYVDMESKATLAVQLIDFNIKINFGQLQT